MSVDVNVKLKGRVLPEQIINAMKEKGFTFLHKHMSASVYEFENAIVREQYDDKTYSYSGIIEFEYKGQHTSFFYAYSSYNCYENLKFYEEKGLADMVKSETTYLSMNVEIDNSFEIMRKIVSYFGGWINDDKIDEENYRYVEGSNPVVKLKDPRWISCTEKLPPEPKENSIFENKKLELYLIDCGEEYPMRAFWNGKTFTDGWSVIYAIAWMPLPKTKNSREN